MLHNPSDALAELRRIRKMHNEGPPQPADPKEPAEFVETTRSTSFSDMPEQTETPVPEKLEQGIFDQTKGVLIGQSKGSVSLPVGTRMRNSMTDEQLRYIFAEVALGRGMHGDFVRHIGKAVAFADDRQFRAIRPLLEWIVAEHQIAWYLEPLG